MTAPYRWFGLSFADRFISDSFPSKFNLVFEWDLNIAIWCIVLNKSRLNAFSISLWTSFLILKYNILSQILQVNTENICKYLTLKGTPDISIYQIAFKVDYICVLYSNSKPKRYNCIIIYSTYQISDLSRKSYHKWLWFWEVQDSRSKIDKSNHSSK